MLCYVTWFSSVTTSDTTCRTQIQAEHQMHSVRGTMVSASLVLLCLLPVMVPALSCLDEYGNPIGWFVQLKFPTTGKYLYADASNSTLDFSSGDVSDAQNGALASTLQQTYGGGNVSQGWIFYNDEPSSSQLKSKLLKQMLMNATTNQMLNSSVEFGHSKGVVGWDQTGGYWIVHSFPKFPDVFDDGYSGVASGELLYGQSVLCVSTDLTGLNVIGQQLQYNHIDIFDYNAPDFSPIDLFNAATGTYVDKPLTTMKSLIATSADKFISFSKTGEWGQALYSDFVAPSLQANLLVETWIRGDRIPSSCPASGYFVKNIESLSFPSQDFKETQDHSKWAISADAENPFVCIGGINQMTTQNKRGGGTVCQNNADLWNSFMALVQDIEDCSSSAKK